MWLIHGAVQRGARATQSLLLDGATGTPCSIKNPTVVAFSHVRQGMDMVEDVVLVVTCTCEHARLCDAENMVFLPSRTKHREIVCLADDGRRGGK